MSTVEGTLFVSRKEVTCKDDAAYHVFFFRDQFFFSINYCYLQNLRSLLSTDCNFALLDFGVSVPPKHLI